MIAKDNSAVEYVGAAKRAWNRMEIILFRPFDMGKWFALGFTAWLATILQSSSGGGGPDFSYSGENTQHSVEGLKGEVATFLDQYGIMILIIFGLVFLVMLAIAMVLAWVQARGHFMFLDNVIRNRALVKRPWKKFRRQGNTLFLWNIAVGLIFLLALGFVAAIGVLSVYPYIKYGSKVFLAVSGVSLAGFLGLALIILGAYIGCFLKDFVTPLMRARDLTVLPAWKCFLELFKKMPGTFLLYGLFKTGLLILVNIAVAGVVIATCCMAGCLLAIPYIGTVIYLPVLVFHRSLGPEFLAQFAGQPDLPPADLSPPPVPAATAPLAKDAVATGISSNPPAC